MPIAGTYVYATARIRAMGTERMIQINNGHYRDGSFEIEIQQMETGRYTDDLTSFQEKLIQSNQKVIDLQRDVRTLEATIDTLESKIPKRKRSKKKEP